jgi:hypothetical protein
MLRLRRIVFQNLIGGSQFEGMRFFVHMTAGEAVAESAAG